MGFFLRYKLECFIGLDLQQLQLSYDVWYCNVDIVNVNINVDLLK